MTEDLLMLSSYKYRSGFMLHIPHLKMTLESYFLVPLIFLSQLVLHSADQESYRGPCPRFHCGELREVGFPFSNTTNPECGLCVMDCTGPEPKVQFHEKGKWYRVADMSDKTIKIHDEDVVQSHLESDLCNKVSPFLNINVTRTPPLVKCKHGPPPVFPSGFFFDKPISCKGYDLYSFDDDEDRSVPESPPSRCSFVPRPPRSVQSHELCMATENPAAWDGYFFTIHWKVWSNCTKCHHNMTGGRCLNKPDRTFKCGNLKKGGTVTRRVAGGTVTRKIGICIGVGAAGSIILLCIVFIIYKHHKSNKSSNSSALISGDLSLEPDLQTQIFTYEELEEATNHFDINRKLGDGGFGTVYHGKLRDGRVVAVKRLFEHNYKRVEQFRNEILILSELRHPNLVPLYGCTNRYSRHLLLVYEYIPNGTVADHLHGSRANDGLLTWPIRLSIAIESANALAYLHASTIIHRDVKTNNILLDNSFHVKVADFGLSRLFPMNVTHISTAPQGTPGYVDPEYHQCYQLTDKSDVYSLGVVLIELISSKPAVDIGRHRHEINLASMALNKIHNQALHELVDPYLGFDTDYGTRNTIILVAELAFRCLQQQKEMRPCMAEVLQILQGIESDEYRKNNIDELDIPADERPLNNSHPLSPNSVTDKWVSKSVTPNTSGSDPFEA